MRRDSDPPLPPRLSPTAGVKAATGAELAYMAGHVGLAGTLNKLSGRHAQAAAGPALQRLAWAFGWQQR